MTELSCLTEICFQICLITLKSICMDIHGSSFVLGEDPDQEISLVVRLEGGGHQQVVSRRQSEALGHLPHVDVRTAPCFRAVVAEKVLPLVVLIIRSLRVR